MVSLCSSKVKRLSNEVPSLGIKKSWQRSMVYNEMPGRVSKDRRFNTEQNYEQWSKLTPA